MIRRHFYSREMESRPWICISCMDLLFRIQNCFSSKYTVSGISWPDCQRDASTESCRANQAFTDGFPDVLNFIKCFDDNGEEMTDIDIVSNFPPLDVGSLNATDGGAWCSVDTTVDASQPGSTLECSIIDYTGLDSCTTAEGNHAVTFWVYFVMRMLWNWFMLSAYALYDGTALRLANEHNSTYAHAMFFAQIAATLGPFLSGYMLRDPPPGSQGTFFLFLQDVFQCIWFPHFPAENDYTICFYVCDACIVLTILMVFKLKAC